MHIFIWQKAVSDFHEKMKIPSRLRPKKDPLLCDAVARSLLILEEGAEATVALIQGNLTESVDGLIDLVYVCLGSLDRWGISADKMLKVTNDELNIGDGRGFAEPKFRLNASKEAEGVLGRTIDAVTAILTGDLEASELRVGDCVFEAVATMVSWGIDPEPIFAEVHRTNMLKSEGVFNPLTGKILKPEGWKPPRIRELLTKQGAWA